MGGADQQAALDGRRWEVRRKGEDVAWDVYKSGTLELMPCGPRLLHSPVLLQSVVDEYSSGVLEWTAVCLPAVTGSRTASLCVGLPTARALCKESEEVPVVSSASLGRSSGGKETLGAENGILTLIAELYRLP